MPRRLRIHRSGWVVCSAALVLGVSAIATGNNLLFLLLGSMLGFIALSGWMSEQVLRKLDVRRRVPGGAEAGQVVLISYELLNRKPRLPSFAVELAELGMEGCTFVPVVEPGESRSARLQRSFPRRGVYALEGIVVSTGFPFGLFSKSRDLMVPGEVVVWPRRDRRVRAPRPGGRALRHGSATANAPGARGEFRGLRDYRPGDDPRDVHWRSSARRTLPVVREHERDNSEVLWLCLDLRGEEGERAEVAVEIVAAHAACACSRGESFTVVTCDVELRPSAGTAQLERVLDALARARFRPDAARVPAPAGEVGSVLISSASPPTGEWGDVFLVDDHA